MASMPGRGKRPGPKLPREEALPAQEESACGFSPVNYPAHGASSYTESAYTPQTQFSRLESGMMAGASSTTMSGPPPGKIAIPALRSSQKTESSQKVNKKGRTSHACDYCRKSKAGCSGEQPCARCRNADVHCVYGDGKRDKERKKLSKLSKETDVLKKYQAEIRGAIRRMRLDPTLTPDDMRANLDDILAMTPAPLSPDGEESRISSEPEGPEDTGDYEADTEVGSTGSIDAINVDMDRDDTRATGHLGKSSSVSWAKRTAEECRQVNVSDPSLGIVDQDFILASYHTEDADIEGFDSTSINPYDWPGYELADILVESYFDHVHNAFPILDRANFMLKYKDFVRNANNLSAVDQIWLSTLNIVFAIAAVFAHLTKSNHRGHHHDHLVYCSRAKMLSMDERLLYEDARVSRTCSLGLLCLYYISTNRLNRAWITCGLAIRDALTLGLHVRSEAENLSDIKKEHRVRLWWSLYSLECSLNELTGRPSCISDRDISTPLPINVDEDDFGTMQPLYRGHGRPSGSRRGSRGRTIRRASATYHMPAGSSLPNISYAFPVLELPVTSSTYFIYRTQLSIISHEIVTHLYCAAAIKLTWNDIQEMIDRIDKRLTTWRDNLPKEFDITFDTLSEPDWNDPYLLPRTGLAMLFNSSRMVLFRPCLCRFEGRIVRQSDKSKDFSQEAVQTCIRSARKMISLLNWSATSVQKLYKILPWWNTLHYLCEALSVLMLEMAFQSQHLPDEAAYILADAKKGISWLIMMSDQSISARKAWEIFDSLVRLVAPLIKHPVFDLPTQAPVPQGYNYPRFNSTSSPTPQLRRLGKSSNKPGLQPLSVSNLQTYQGSQQNVTDAAATTAWTSQDQQDLLGMNTSYSRSQFELLAGNPLDYTTAVERFSSIGLVHGHYDEPWRHMFSPSGGFAGPSGMAGGHFTEDQEMMGGGEQRYFGEQSGFGGEAFDSMGEEDQRFGGGFEDQRTSQDAGRGRDGGSGSCSGGFGTGRERYFY